MSNHIGATTTAIGLFLDNDARAEGFGPLPIHKHLFTTTMPKSDTRGSGFGRKRTVSKNSLGLLRFETFTTCPNIGQGRMTEDFGAVKDNHPEESRRKRTCTTEANPGQGRPPRKRFIRPVR